MFTSGCEKGKEERRWNSLDCIASKLDDAKLEKLKEDIFDLNQKMKSGFITYRLLYGSAFPV